MKYKEAVFLCIKYIEKNLKQELSAEIIAREIGYSVYHFSRIFKYEMGISLMEYVKERKLLSAAEDIMSGKRVLDTAIEYGYETHSGLQQNSIIRN
jgi:Adenosine deaminase